MRMKNSQKTQATPPPSSSAPKKVPPNENIQELYEYVQGSLNFIEAKNGVLVALFGGLIAAILSFSPENSHRLWLYLSIVPPTAALIPLLFSFYPVTRRKRKNKTAQGSGENMGLFRCENIAKLSKDELSLRLSEQLDSHKIEYLHSASKTAARKYRLSRISIKLLFWLYAADVAALVIGWIYYAIKCFTIK
jgi:hypothetical protein